MNLGTCGWGTTSWQLRAMALTAQPRVCAETCGSKLGPDARHTRCNGAVQQGLDFHILVSAARLPYGVCAMINTHPSCQRDVDDREWHFILATGDEDAPRCQQICFRDVFCAGPARSDLLHECTGPGLDGSTDSEHVCKPLHVLPKGNELRAQQTSLR